MSAKEYQRDLLMIIGKTDATITELSKATGHGRDYIRERLYGLPHGGGAQNKTYAICDAAKRLYPKR